MCRCAASSLLWLLTLLASTTGALDKPDISWGDWILVEDSASADSGASILLRRITPKSVFVAPNFNNCPEGYRQDALGRCVKLVQVNKQAQWNFFLEKLNSMYAPSPSQGAKESGPFHVNLPIGGGSRPPAEVKPTTQAPALPETELPSTAEDLVTTVKVDRDTTKLEQETTVPRYDFETTTSTFWTETASKSPDTTTFVPSRETTLEQETTTNVEQGTTVNMRHSENQTELLDRDETVKRPFIIVVTGQPELESTTNVETTTSDSASEATEQGVESTTTEQQIRVKLPHSAKSKCDLSIQVAGLKDDLASNIDCEPLPENPPVTASPPAEIEPVSQVRFPSKSDVPVRKASGYVRFPDDRKVWENTRQTFRWPPAWEYQQHPDILAWPPVEKPSTYQHYNPKSSIHHTQTWSNSPPWNRRINQRD